MSAVGEDQDDLKAATDVLKAIWCDVLGVDRVEVDDDFFDLGGHSLLATQVAARAKALLGVRVRLNQIFSHPTIAGLAAEIAQCRRKTSQKTTA